VINDNHPDIERSRPEASAPTARPYRYSAVAFYSFAALIAVDIGFLTALNTGGGDVRYWVMLSVIGGGVLTWAVVAARRLRFGRPAAAIALLGTLTGLALLGAAITAALHGANSAPGPEGARAVARIATGAAILVLWVVLIRESRGRGQN